jgi:hypothetical protein
MFQGQGCAADGTMAAKNPIGRLVDSVLDTRMRERGMMGPGGGMMMGGDMARMRAGVSEFRRTVSCVGGDARHDSPAPGCVSVC